MYQFISIIFLTHFLFLGCKGTPVGGDYTEIQSGRVPSVQVVNNTGVSLSSVSVQTVGFTSNLSSCFNGCSTGFKDVPKGVNAILLLETSSPTPQTIGTIGIFESNKHYALNMIKSGDKFCAELWVRTDTSSTFNQDSTKVKLSTACAPTASTQVTNNSGELIPLVKVGNTTFTQNLQSCGTGCSTGFKGVPAGSPEVTLFYPVVSPVNLNMGRLGVFEDGKQYSVNFVKSGAKFCTELWERADASQPFNMDNTKVKKSGPHCENLPIMQVVDSTTDSSHRISKVTVSGVEFTANLGGGGGGSTGFKDVRWSTPTATVIEDQQNSTMHNLNTLDVNKKYALNVLTDGAIHCIELWERVDTGPTFDDDITKVRVHSTCP